MSGTRNRKFEIIDDDGNVMPPPAPGSDIYALMYFLEYAREREFFVGPVIKVGEVVVTVTDLRQRRQLTEAETPKHPETTIWEQHGYQEPPKT